MLARGITLAGKPVRESEEVMNMARALEYLDTLATGEVPIREVDLREVHRLILGSGERSRGISED